VYGGSGGGGVCVFCKLFFHCIHAIFRLNQHHILVNSTNPNLDLTQGQVSTALLAVGGDGIQTECLQKYPKGIKRGEIAVTGPGRTKVDARQH
jgi:O-acetyl-ADP-ribose deacetylase (regulator of RNase III)